MSTDNVTPIRATAKRPARTRKVEARVPDVYLLSQAEWIIDIGRTFYSEAKSGDLRHLVQVARGLVQRWFDDHEDVDQSEEAYDAIGLLIMLDVTLRDDVKINSATVDPYLSMLNAADSLLRAAIRKPLDG